MNARLFAILLTAGVAVACGGAVEGRGAVDGGGGIAGPCGDAEVGCGSVEDAGEHGELGPLDDSAVGDDGMLVDRLATQVFDMNRLLLDEDLTGAQWITTGQVQGFLTAQKSFLAGYTDPVWGKTAAALIVERSRAHGVSPLYMLARIQVESRLIQSGVSTNLVKATACGCPDGSSCVEQYQGFGNQIECGARKLRGYLTSLEAGSATVAGWQRGVTRTSGDPCTVKPANNATAALYTYTPWVGAYATQCGRKDVGGSSLVALVFNRYLTGYTWGAGPAPATECYSGTLDRNVPSGTCVQSASDALWRQCRSGSFTAGSRTEPANCRTPSFPYCESASLARAVPSRSCVQSRSNGDWFQCGANGVWDAAPSAPTTGAGPVGDCASINEL